MVLLSDVSTGSADMGQVPIDEIYPLSGVHANAVNTVLTGSFIRELQYPGTVRCRLYVGQIGRSSFETIAVLSRTDDPDTVYAEGGAKVVWMADIGFGYSDVVIEAGRLYTMGLVNAKWTFLCLDAGNGKTSSRR